MSRQDISAERAQCCVPLTTDPLTAGQAEGLARWFKALGDPVRLRLLSLIASHEGGEACVCELTVGFEVSGPTISHHLKVLRETGLIEGDRRGTWIYYRVELQLLENSMATMFGLAVLILLFGPVSGAHFNPVVSAVDWLSGRRTHTGLSGRDVWGYTAAQVIGAVAGARCWPT
jgi:ArsR family transcriptional regulator